MTGFCCHFQVLIFHCLQLVLVGMRLDNNQHIPSNLLSLVPSPQSCPWPGGLPECHWRWWKHQGQTFVLATREHKMGEWCLLWMKAVSGSMNQNYEMTLSTVLRCYAILITNHHSQNNLPLPVTLTIPARWPHKLIQEFCKWWRSHVSDESL